MAKGKEKSEVEDALFDAKKLMESINVNTKGILRSIAKEEIDGLVNESFEEEDEDIDLDIDGGSDDTEDITADAGVEAGDDFGAEVGDDAGVDAGADTDFELGADDSEEGSFDYEEEDGIASDEDDYEFDMTSATDDDVIKVFKKLSGEDEIEIINDNEVNITDPDSGSEYHVKLGDGGAETPAVGVEAPAEDFGPEEDDVEYEIDLDGGDDSEFGSDDSEEELDLDLDSEESEDTEEDDEEISEDIIRGKGHDTYAGGGSLPTGDIEGTKGVADTDSGDNLDGGFDDDAVSHANAEGPTVMAEDEEDDINEDEELLDEEEVDEQIRQGQSQSRRVPGKADIGQPNGPGAVVETKKYNALVKEYRALVQENKEFKGALKEFRNMINEIGVFNTNLTYATRLFTEHSTTKDEKREILKRFDNEAASVKESKKVFKSIQEGLNKRTPLAESVGNKVSGADKSSSKSQINESTGYVDPSTKRMLELMGHKPKY